MSVSALLCSALAYIWRLAFIFFLFFWWEPGRLESLERHFIGTGIYKDRLVEEGAGAGEGS